MTKIKYVGLFVLDATDAFFLETGIAEYIWQTLLLLVFYSSKHNSNVPNPADYLE